MNFHPALVRAAAALVMVAASTIALAADKDEFEAHAEKLRSGPARAPLQNDTGFSKGLRCMDGLFRAFGVKNVTVVIDEIPDATKKVNVGARDMFMSATSQMTRTTHAIRLVPMVESRVFNDSARQRVVANSDFVLQGSISQFDDSMLQKQRDGAVCLWYLCIGAADSDAFSGLGLDLNLVETSGMSLVPGANVRNAVLIRKKGRGYDGDLTLKKFSVQFNFTLVSSDGNGQALRTLIDLGAIELYGRLLKLPYWNCLGASDQDPEVKGEINDWWEEMAADPHERGRLMAYLQFQMKAQGLYDAEVNGRADPALLRAVRAYRLALGMPDDLNLDAGFLARYLGADHAEVRKLASTRLAEIAQREGPLAPAPVAQATPSPQGPSPVQGGSTAPSATPDQSASPAAAGRALPAPIASTTSTSAPPAAASVPPSSMPARALAQPATAPAATTPPPAAASQPAASSPVAAAAATSPQPAAGMKPVAFRPAGADAAAIPIRGSRPANKTAYRPGEPFFVGLISPQDGYLYCYLVDDRQRVAQFFPTPTQPLSRVTGGSLSVLPSTSGPPLVAGRTGRQQTVACFSSLKDLGQQPLDVGGMAGGLEALKSRFADASSGSFGMGVFDVKVQ